MRQRGDLIEVVRVSLCCKKCTRQTSATFVLSDEGKLCLAGRFLSVHHAVHVMDTRRKAAKIFDVYEV